MESLDIDDLNIILESLKNSIHYMDNKPIPEYYPSYEYKQDRINPLRETAQKVQKLKEAATTQR